MKLIKEYLNGIVFCVFELIVGILLLIRPVGFTSGIIMIAGVGLVLMGIKEVIKYFRMDVQEASQRQNLMKGIFAILSGGFCVFKKEWFLATFPVLTIIYGVFILLTGIGKIQLTVDMLRRKNQKWFWAAINAAISVVCALIILKSPFTSTAVLWMFTGISLIVEGIFDVITLIMSEK